jgi:hypothetical protein
MTATTTHFNQESRDIRHCDDPAFSDEVVVETPQDQSPVMRASDPASQRFVEETPITALYSVVTETAIGSVWP